MSDGAKGTGVLLGAAAYASWGLLAPVGKLLLEPFGPWWLNAFRMIVATTILVLVVGPKRVAAGARMLRDPHLLVTVVAGGGISFTFFVAALEHIDATFVALAFYTAPLWTAALAWLRLREPVGRSFFVAVPFMLGGAWLALDPIGSTPSLVGLGLALASAVVWAFYTVELRSIAPDAPMRPLLVATFLASTLYYLVAALVFAGAPTLPAGGVVWGWLLVYGLVPTLAAFLLFQAALKRAKAGDVSVMVGMELLVAALIAGPLLGEWLGVSQWIGLGVVLASVGIYARISAGREARAAVA